MGRVAPAVLVSLRRKASGSLFALGTLLTGCTTDLMNEHDPADAWRVEARQRIDVHRKADLTIRVVDAQGRPVPNAQVEVHMLRHAFYFGAAVTAQRLTDASSKGRRYRRHVARNFNKVTLENDLKWEQWVASASGAAGARYTREQTFAALEWLREQDIPVRGHYLSWGGLAHFKPFQRAVDPERFLNALFTHIWEKARAVGDAVAEWDALNHPVKPAPRGETLRELYGRDIFRRILRTARTAAPGRRLYVNEAGILPQPHPSLAEYEALIDYLVDNDAPLDGIGFMAHFEQRDLTPPRELLRILDRFSRFGLPLLVTEFDIRFGAPGTSYQMTPADLRLQADYTRDFMTAVFSHPAAEGIMMWAFWQGEPWYPGAELYRNDWSKKPNALVWEHLVFEEWWTDATGITGADGAFTVRAFLGEHRVRVNQGERIACVRLQPGGQTLKLRLGESANSSRARDIGCE